MREVKEKTLTLKPPEAAAPTGAEGEHHDSFSEMINGLAMDVLNEARTMLMMSYRFMDTALWKMPVVLDPHPLPFDTNGRSLYMSPLFVLARFDEGRNEVVRDYLHVLLHCVFRHPMDEEHLNTSAWSLACDLIVESIALEMAEGRFDCADDARRREELEFIKERIGRMTPTKLYRVFAGAELNDPRALEQGFTAAKVWDLRQLFQRGAHEAWANNREKQGQGTQSDEESAIRKRNLSDRLQDEANKPEEPEEPEEPQTPTLMDDPDEAEMESQQMGDEDDQPQEGEDAETHDAYETEEDSGDSEEDALNTDDEADEPQEDAPGEQEGDAEEQDQPEMDEAQLEALEQQVREELEQARQEWEEIAKQMEVDLETFSRQREDKSGALSENLAIANRRLANYNDFLRQFAVMGEDMKINDDEFDYIYYTYGMEMYGNMPLVEPLEYQESNRVREFVVALDTSGSCSGELVKQFVTRTYDILRETEGFGDKVNIHLIQCDDKIRADLKIEHVEDLEKFCREFTVYGYGGTDFRPVFSYVQEMVDNGEFENLRGLIYFTDGKGTFPKLAPQFETAFVFLDEGASHITVPPWAMKVVMDEEEIFNL